MPTKHPPAAIRLAVETYLAGKASMGDIARELGVTTPTVSRWVKDARSKGVTAASAPPATPAERVAALAPPPAPPRPPAISMGDGSPASMAAALEALVSRLTDQVERAQAQSDPRVATQALSAALNAMREIRQLQRTMREDGADGYTFTLEEIAAARESVQRKIDALGPATCPHCGAELRRLWALEGVTRDATVTGNKSGAGA